MSDPPTKQDRTGPEDEPPAAKLLQLLGGKWVANTVYAAAELGVADALADGPRTAEQVAEAVGIRADGATRLLRALTTVDVCTRTDDGAFGLTPVGDHLTSDHPVSMAGWFRVHSRPWHHRIWEGFVDQLRTGECAMEAVHGQAWNAFLADRPADERAFGEAMASLTAVNAPAVVASYDFSAFETIVDVGGGYGTLLTAILDSSPDLQGVLFELPSVAEGAREHLTSKDVADRIEVVDGDYTEAVPEGGDAYLLSNILHNHQDAEAAALLDRIRQAMAPGGRVVVVDFLLGEEADLAALLDLELMVTLDGRQRTLDEFEALLAKAGFDEPTVHATPTPLSVIEAEPA